jgi:HlyD family secretion protein
MRNRFVVLSAVVLTAALFGGCGSSKGKAASYEFTNIRQGTLERTVYSSGTINPVAAVKILPRMSGKVERVYVDYNDVVHKGDILAELNTDMLRLQRDQQVASVQKARANYELLLSNYRSQQSLADKGLISEYELRQSKTTLDNQAADLAVAETNLRVIDNEINQYAFVTSPIDGIVLDRNINIGDTVVESSNNNTSMFTIAENMREMQIEAAVGELDISSINRGQEVRFTMESMPGRRFSGIVDNMRMVPVVQNGVVSYTVIINVENQDGSLMPGMTCAVDFIVERVENVLMVSNAALRYQPTSLGAEQISEMVFNASLENMNEEQRNAAREAREASAQAGEQRQNQNSGPSITSLLSGGGMRMGGGNQQRQGAGQQQRGAAPVITWRNLWFINAEGKLSVMQVRTGINSGTFTEIYLTEDYEGQQVILRERV